MAEQVIVLSGRTVEGERRTEFVGPGGRSLGFVAGEGDQTRGIMVIDSNVLPGMDLFGGVAASEEADKLLSREMAERGAMRVKGDEPRRSSSRSYSMPSKLFERNWGKIDWGSN